MQDALSLIDMRIVNNTNFVLQKYPDTLATTEMQALFCLAAAFMPSAYLLPILTLFTSFKNPAIACTVAGISGQDWGGEGGYEELAY